MTGQSVILVEVDVVDPAGVQTTLRFSDRPVAPMAPADAARPNAVWDDRLIEAPTLRRSLFDDLQSLAPGLGVGAMVLANGDRALDVYQASVWGEVRVWRWIEGAAFADATRLMTGPAAGTPAFDAGTSRPGRVRLTLFDYRLALESPLQAASYGGANEDDDDIYFDGDETLKGQLKPLAFGDLRTAHIKAPFASISRSAYQLHDGVVLDDPDIGQVLAYDRGGDAGIAFFGPATGLIDDEGFADYDLYSWWPPEDPRPPDDMMEPGMVLWPSRGLLRLNAISVGELVFGFRGDATDGDYVETPAPVIARILKRVGIPVDRIGESFGLFDCDHVVGAYSQQPTTIREFIGWIALAAPMAVLPDRFGVWQAIAIAPPSAEAAITVRGSDILNLEADDDAPRGAGEFSVGWDRIWTTYRRESLQPVLWRTATEIRLAEPYRYVNLDDPAFKARFPSAWRRLKIDTPLRQQAHAEVVAGRLKALFGLRPDGRPRRQWRVTLELTEVVQAIELGATVALAAPEFGPDDRFLLIGEEPLRPRRDQIIWTLWG